MGVIERVKKELSSGLEWLIGLLVCVAVFGVWAAGSAVWQNASGSLTETVFIERDKAPDVPAKDGVSLEFDTGVLKVDAPTTGERVISMAPDIFGGLLVAVVALLLFSAARAMRGPGGFGAQNVRRVRAAGWIAVTGGIIVAYIDMFSQLEFGLIGEEAGLPTATAAMGTWVPALFGVMTLVMAELLARASAMREELDEVI